VSADEVLVGAVRKLEVRAGDVVVVEMTTEVPSGKSLALADLLKRHFPEIKFLFTSPEARVKGVLRFDGRREGAR